MNSGALLQRAHNSKSFASLHANTGIPRRSTTPSPNHSGWPHHQSHHDERYDDSQRSAALRNDNRMSSILPRVSGYKRVDDDARPGRLKFGWKKFAVGAAVLIGMVWLFGPRERREQVLEKIKTPSWVKPIIPDKGVPPAEDSDIEEPSKALPAAVHSPEDDPDPLKTVHCFRPYNSNDRLVQYALMIDAGSTGSRIHIYKFNNCGPSAAYEYEVFKQTKPGLSSYASDALEAAQSLDVLLDEAVKVVPQELHKCTPVAVKATAGLRLLGERESTDILNAVRHRLEEKYPFSVVQKDGVVVMDGAEEGVYAWITANYLLNTIRADSPAGSHSLAVLDLGGASTQIVFEPNFGDSEADSAFRDGDHKYELDFGGKKHVLYQHSYLGYGLMRARKSVHRLAEFMATFNRAPSDEPTRPEGEIANPCLAKGTTRRVELEATLPGETVRNVTMTGADVGSFEGCNRVVELVMAKDAVCLLKPCSFNGVYQPSILETFPHGNVLLLSYFYDRIAPLLPSERPPLTVSTIADLATDICQGEPKWMDRWGDDADLLAELRDRPEWCLDMTFMHGLLRLGYEFGEERQVRIEKQLDGTELGWCLGAAIAVVGGELTCRV